MRTRTSARVGLSVLGAAACVWLGAPVGRADSSDYLAAPAQNVILLIGDGMGDSEITLARNYALGASGRLDLDTLPVTGAYTTYSVQESDPALPDYVTDSAASGTAWATGTKTSNGRISTLAGSATVAPLTTIDVIASVVTDMLNPHVVSALLSIARWRAVFQDHA